MTTPPVDPPRGAPGQVLAGKYELVREIGRGGMGVVWRAERLDWDRAPVAVKLMVPKLDTPVARARFDREAQTAVKLRSTHVVQVLDHGIDEQTDTPFLVMELLEGQSLRARLDHLKVLSPDEVLLVAKHLGRALSHASRFHVVHRDLKPENVFLADNGDEHNVKVLDFGLAKVFDSRMTIDSRAMTAPGNAVGTPWYMSPEQIRRAEPDQRGDLWSFAVIVFECLVGRRPFEAPDLGALAAQIFTDPRPVPSQLGLDLPGFDDWFAKATHRHIEHRFQTANELVEALSPICGTRRGPLPPLVYEKQSHPRAPSSPPVTRPPETRTPLSRRSLGISVIVGLLLGGTGIIAYFVAHESASVAPRASASSSQATVPTLTTGSSVAEPPGQSPPTLHAPAPVAPSPPQAEADLARPPPTVRPVVDAVEPAHAATTQPSRPVPRKKPRRPRTTTPAPPPARTDTEDLIDREF
jgi:serine/threonine protein kinase